jgi:endonuclease III related protein
LKKTDRAGQLSEIYKLLYKRFGPQYWWPGRTRLEIIIGAILTQNTAWKNVEKAIANLRKEKILNVKGLSSVSREKLARLIRPSGYYNIKTGRIKNFLDFLNGKYNGSINRLFLTETEKLREELLGINGIGRETADSILLYAGEKPVFVVDAYTKRILSRHEIVDENASYEEIQKLFRDNLPSDVRLFNEYHALIVELGKNICVSRKPLCNVCPIERIGGIKNG